MTETDYIILIERLIGVEKEDNGRTNVAYDDYGGYCFFCGNPEDVPHAADCPYVEAKALLERVESEA